MRIQSMGRPALVPPKTNQAAAAQLPNFEWVWFDLRSLGRMNPQ